MSYCTIRESFGDLEIRFGLDENFFDAVDDLKRIPTAHFNGGSKTWTISAIYSCRVEAWASEHFDAHEITWKGRYGGSGYSRRGASGKYQNRDEYSQQQFKTGTKVEAAFAALHLAPSAPLWAAEAVHRASVKRYHPDRGEGGDNATMARINAAFDLVKASLT